MICLISLNGVNFFPPYLKTKTITTAHYDPPYNYVFFYFDRHISVSESLWDKREINLSLRNFALHDPNPCLEEILSAVELDDADTVEKKVKVCLRISIN